MLQAPRHLAERENKFMIIMFLYGTENTNEGGFESQVRLDVSDLRDGVSECIVKPYDPAARPEAFTATTADFYALALRMHIRFLDFSLSSCRKIEYMDVKEVFIQFRDEVN